MLAGAAYVLVRLPLLSRPIVFEEGIFATLMVFHPPGPDYGLIGRIGGTELYTPLEHPAALYESVSWLGRLAAPLLPSPDVPRIVPALRLQMAALGLLAWLPLIALGIWRHRTTSLLVAAFPVLAAISPLAAFTSTELQVDGSVGVVMVGVLAALMAAASWSSRPTRRWSWALGVGAFVLGLGKQEWSLALVAAGVAVAVACVDPVWRGRVIEWWRVWLAMAIGLVAGHVVSALADPENYAGGFRTMSGFSGADISMSGYLWRLAGVTYWRAAMMPALVSPLVLALALLWWRYRSMRGEVHPLALLLVAYASAINGAYLVSSWNSAARYFAPGLVIAVAALLTVAGQRHAERSEASPPPMLRRLAIACAVVMIVHIVGFQLRWLQTTWPPDEFAAARAGGCVPALSPGAVWNRPDVEFVTSAMYPPAARQIVEQHGRQMCEE